VPFALRLYSYLPEQARRAGAPVDWIALPPTIAATDAVGIAARAPHPRSARLFYDFMLGEGQALMAEMGHVISQRRAAPELERFRDEAGRLLYDLEASPRPSAELAAPVRYLSWFDSLLLAYAPPHRGRILPEPYRAAVIRTANLQVLATFLVDGMVAGTWEVEAGRRLATLVVRPLGRIERTAKKALEDEGERLVRFLRPEAGSHGVRFEAG